MRGDAATVIAGAIDALMVRRGQGRKRFQNRNAIEDAIGVVGMQADTFPFRSR